MGIAGSILDDEPISFSSPTKLSNTTVTKTDHKSDSGTHPTFVVTLGFWPNNNINLPPSFHLKVSSESLDFCNIEGGAPLVQFPYQTIICWGSSPKNFQFKVFNKDKATITVDNEARNSGVLITLKTNQGKMIENATMSTVQTLMADMNHRAISNEEFAVLLTELFNEQNVLREDWMPVINQFTSSGRSFLAKQCMELLLKIGQQAPFEKIDLACLLYERLLNKNSIQLIVNTFEDQLERQNLIHRLKLNPQNISASVVTLLPNDDKSFT